MIIIVCVQLFSVKYKFIVSCEFKQNMQDVYCSTIYNIHLANTISCEYNMLYYNATSLCEGEIFDRQTQRAQICCHDNWNGPQRERRYISIYIHRWIWWFARHIPGALLSCMHPDAGTALAHQQTISCQGHGISSLNWGSLVFDIRHHSPTFFCAQLEAKLTSTRQLCLQGTIDVSNSGYENQSDEKGLSIDE